MYLHVYMRTGVNTSKMKSYHRNICVCDCVLWNWQHLNIIEINFSNTFRKVLSHIKRRLIILRNKLYVYCKLGKITTRLKRLHIYLFLVFSFESLIIRKYLSRKSLRRTKVMKIMVIWVVKFSKEGYNSITILKRKLLDFVNRFVFLVQIGYLSAC